MAGERHGNLHAIMIPLPFQGHINPFFDFALKLASEGITVTFVHFEFIHQMISKAGNNNSCDVDLFSQAQKPGLDIRSATIGDGFPLDFDRNLHFEEWLDVMWIESPARVDELIEKTIKSEPSLIYFIVADIYAWLATVAKKYNLASVSFWTNRHSCIH